MELVKILQSIDNNEYTIGVFLDLAKAFDTVNHQILLGKLEHYGIRGVALDWFKESCWSSFIVIHVQYNIWFTSIQSTVQTIALTPPPLGPSFALVRLPRQNKDGG